MSPVYRFFVLSALLLFISCKKLSDSQVATPKKEVGLIADKAMVVSAHPLASKVGVDIMKKGGNAIDAAIATLDKTMGETEKKMTAEGVTMT